MSEHPDLIFGASFLLAVIVILILSAGKIGFPRFTGLIPEILRLCSLLAVYALFLIGVVSLIIPESRAILQSVFQEAWKELRDMLKA